MNASNLSIFRSIFILIFTWISSYVRETEQKQQVLSKNAFNTALGEKIPRHGRGLGRDSVITGVIPWSRMGSEIMTVGGVISVVENMWSVGETVVKRGNWHGQRKNWEMLSTITSVILGRTKICDIDMLLIVGTSSLFNNVMQTVHELMLKLLPLHWENITIHLDLV